MSVLVGLFCEFSYNFYESLHIFIKTRNLAKSKDYFTMSYRSIDTLSSCEEIDEADFCGLRSCTPSDVRSESRSDVILSLPGIYHLISKLFVSSYIFMKSFLSVKQLHPGSSFNISGLLFNTCEKLAINLIATSKTSDIALHFNPRPLQNYIVRNSLICGKILKDN